jgi:hypothetical protein
MHMTTQLTGFQKNFMGDVVREHAVATDHSPYCCETARRYEEQLADCTLKPDVKGAGNAEWKRNNGGGTGRATAMKGSPASDAQVNYVKGLMLERDYSALEGKTWNAMLANGMSVREASTIIQKLKERSRRNDIVSSDGIVGRPASDKQVSFILSLADQKDWSQEAPEATAIQAAIDDREIGIKDASAAINYLIGCPKLVASVTAKETGTEGIYFFEGEYYKVQRAVHGSGRLYSKKFDREEESWSRGGSLGKLTPEFLVTQEQAKQFGDLYGQCIRCHATLTDEESIERGVGPICFSKMGF